LCVNLKAKNLLRLLQTENQIKKVVKNECHGKNIFHLTED
jgi:hypothetical protein